MTPHDINIERAVLGSIIAHKESQAVCFALLETEDFYRNEHQVYYGFLAEMFEASEPIELDSFQSKLKVNGVSLDNFSDIALTGCSPSTVEYNARLIKQFSILRSLIELGAEVHSEAKDISADPFAIMESVEQKIMELSGVLTKKKPVQIGKLTAPVIKIIEEIRAGTRKGYGLQTGFSKLDEYTGGFDGGDLIIIGGRPSQGKTSLVLTILKNIARSQVPAGFFSLEMANRQLVLRSLASDANLEHYKLRTGHLQDSEMSDVRRVVEKQANLKLYIDDQPAISLLELKAKTKRLVSEHGVKIIGVDYLQLMTPPKTKGGSREQEVSAISAGLKALAKELDIPVIGLASMNRQTAQTASKRPELHQLRESGGIESDADLVILVHRPEFYGDDKDIDGEDSRGIAEINIAKQRNGKTGLFKLAFLDKSVSFRDLSDRQCQAPQGREEVF